MILPDHGAYLVNITNGGVDWFGGAIGPYIQVVRQRIYRRLPGAGNGKALITVPLAGNRLVGAAGIRVLVTVICSVRTGVVSTPQLVMAFTVIVCVPSVVQFTETDTPVVANRLPPPDSDQA